MQDYASSTHLLHLRADVISTNTSASCGHVRVHTGHSVSCQQAGASDLSNFQTFSPAKCVWTGSIPPSLGSSPVSTEIVVVLPAPFGPSSPKTSPLLIERQRSLIACFVTRLPLDTCSSSGWRDDNMLPTKTQYALT